MDYILKPITEERLKGGMEKYWRRWKKVRRQSPRNTRILVKFVPMIMGS